METQPGISLKTRPYFTDCIHWNDNGQLSVCLDNGVHIVVKRDPPSSFYTRNLTL